MNRSESFYVYRFRNVVALSTTIETPDGDSASGTGHYLAPETARALAAQLVAFADDVDACKFTASTLAPVTVPAVAQ
jgi:hypothetical protein